MQFFLFASLILFTNTTKKFLFQCNLIKFHQRFYKYICEVIKHTQFHQNLLIDNHHSIKVINVIRDPKHFMNISNKIFLYQTTVEGQEIAKHIQ